MGWCKQTTFVFTINMAIYLMTLYFAIGVVQYKALQCLCWIV